MIKTVKIAPIEKWCDVILKASSGFPQRDKLVGMEVQILTHTLKPGLDNDEQCAGKQWTMERKSQDRVDMILFGKPLNKSQWCEHMLEID